MSISLYQSILSHMTNLGLNGQQYCGDVFRQRVRELLQSSLSEDEQVVAITKIIKFAFEQGEMRTAKNIAQSVKTIEDNRRRSIGNECLDPDLGS